MRMSDSCSAETGSQKRSDPPGDDYEDAQGSELRNIRGGVEPGENRCCCSDLGEICRCKLSGKDRSSSPGEICQEECRESTSENESTVD